jgi:hypothetical protein
VCSFLRGVALFAHCSEAELRALAAAVSAVLNSSLVTVPSPRHASYAVLRRATAMFSHCLVYCRRSLHVCC